MKKTTFFYCLLMISISTPNRFFAQSSGAKITFVPANVKDHCFLFYFDRFGDEQVEFLCQDEGKKLNTRINNNNPSIIFFGSHLAIYQPYIISSSNQLDSLNFVVEKSNKRYQFKTSKNHCNELFLEKSESKFSYLNLGSSIFYDINELESEGIRNSARYTHKYIKGDSILWKEKLQYLNDFNDTCRLDSDKVSVLKETLQDFFMLKVIIKSLENNPDSLEADINLINTILGFKSFISNRLTLAKGDGVLIRQLIYYYNLWLARLSLGTNKEFEELWKSSSQNFQNDTKDFLQFFLLRKYLSRRVVNYDVFYSAYMKNNKKTDYGKYLDSLKRNYHYKFNAEELNSTLQDTSGNKITLKKLITSNRKKIIYLDCWASWCNPCRAEMRKYESLNNELTTNNVEPIFLSIDKKDDAWKKAIVQTNMTGYKHYIVQENTALFKLLSSTPIPHYLVIDKTGKVADFNAPRPSQKEVLMNLIKSLSVK